MNYAISGHARFTDTMSDYLGSTSNPLGLVSGEAIITSFPDTGSYRLVREGGVVNVYRTPTGTATADNMTAGPPSIAEIQARNRRYWDTPRRG